jgi:hypothetical protein
MSDPRFDAVAAVLQEYFDGLCHSDTQRLRRVFHPQAVYACATAEPAVILRMEEYFPIVDQRPSPASRGETVQERILSIEFAGPVTALAKVECAQALHRPADADLCGRALADHCQGFSLRTGSLRRRYAQRDGRARK